MPRVSYHVQMMQQCGLWPVQGTPIMHTVVQHGQFALLFARHAPADINNTEDIKKDACSTSDTAWGLSTKLPPPFCPSACTLTRPAHACGDKQQQTCSATHKLHAHITLLTTHRSFPCTRCPCTACQAPEEAALSPQRPRTQHYTPTPSSSSSSGSAAGILAPARHEPRHTAEATADGLWLAMHSVGHQPAALLLASLPPSLPASPQPLLRTPQLHG